MKFSNERFRAYLPFFYIDAMRPGDFYDLDEIWQQKDLLDFGDFEKEGAHPIVEVYYPYHDPAFIRLHWWNDTYSGVVCTKAVNEPGWVKLDVTYEDLKFETYKGPEEECKRHQNRQLFLQVNDDVKYALTNIYNAVKAKKDPSENDMKVLKRVNTNLELQRSW